MLLLLNPNPSPLAVRATFYLSAGRVVTRRMTVAAGARYTLVVNTSAAELAHALYGVRLASADGRGFVAEQSIYGLADTTVYGTAGLAQ